MCTADGIPTPKLSWYKDAGDKLETKGEVEIVNTLGSSSLTIKKVNSMDAGTYICKSENRAGTVEVKGVLQVICKYGLESDFLFQSFGISINSSRSANCIKLHSALRMVDSSSFWLVSPYFHLFLFVLVWGILVLILRRSKKMNVWPFYSISLRSAE